MQGSNLCLEHKQRKSEQDKLRISKRISKRKYNKLCVSCGNSSDLQTCSSCKEQRVSFFKTREKNNLCKHCNNPKLINSVYCISCKDYHYNYNRQLRQIVYDRYGNVCACCGETISEFFSIDHVNNDGNIERKLGIKSQKLLRKVIAESFPDKYQILCFNCNIAKAIYSYCPHQLNKSDIKKQNETS